MYVIKLCNINIMIGEYSDDYIYIFHFLTMYVIKLCNINMLMICLSYKNLFVTVRCSVSNICGRMENHDDLKLVSPATVANNKYRQNTNRVMQMTLK